MLNSYMAMETNSAASAYKGRVLIVEDDPAMVALLESMLEEEGYEVRSELGEKALALALVYKPDLVLLDVMMPNMNGLEWSNRVKAHPQLKDIPIIALSAADAHSLKTTFKDLQADSFLSKPFDIDVLMNLIDSLSHRYA